MRYATTLFTERIFKQASTAAPTKLDLGIAADDG